MAEQLEHAKALPLIVFPVSMEVLQQRLADELTLCEHNVRESSQGGCAPDRALELYWRGRLDSVRNILALLPT